MNSLFETDLSRWTPRAARSARDYLGLSGRVVIMARTGPMLGTFCWGAYDSWDEAEARLDAARDACGPNVRIIDTEPPTAWDKVNTNPFEDVVAP